MSFYSIGRGVASNRRAGLFGAFDFLKRHRSGDMPSSGQAGMLQSWPRRRTSEAMPPVLKVDQDGVFHKENLESPCCQIPLGRRRRRHATLSRYVPQTPATKGAVPPRLVEDPRRALNDERHISN